MQFTEHQFTDAVEQTQQYVVDEIEFRPDYSGRVMHGEKCHAVVGAPRDLAMFELQLALTVTNGPENGSVDVDDLSDAYDMILESRCTDSMGVDTIFYYPEHSRRN